MGPMMDLTNQNGHPSRPARVMLSERSRSPERSERGRSSGALDTDSSFHSEWHAL